MWCLAGTLKKKAFLKKKNTFEAKQKQKPGRRQSGLPEMKTMKILGKKSGCKKFGSFRNEAPYNRRWWIHFNGLFFIMTELVRCCLEGELETDLC